MPYGEYAKCPCCGKTVYGRDHIGKMIPQSYLKNVVLLVANIT